MLNIKTNIYFCYSIQVVGNMGDAMEAANPEIKNILLKCMRQPATTLSVQLSAIQAFRRMSVTDEVTPTFLSISNFVVTKKYSYFEN